MNRYERGITVFDLLVTLAIAAVVIALAVPGFQAWSRHHSMNAAISALQADLRLARSEAIRLRVPVALCPTQASGRCATLPHWHLGWLVFADTDGDREPDPGEPVLRTSPAIQGLGITSAPSRRQLRFSPRGSAPGSNASVTFCDDRGPGQAHQLRLSASGRIRALEPAEANVAAC